MWNLPAPGIELRSPALAGRFLTTGSPLTHEVPQTGQHLLREAGKYANLTCTKALSGVMAMIYIMIGVPVKFPY